MGCFCGIGGGEEGGRTAPNVFEFRVLLVFLLHIAGYAPKPS